MNRATTISAAALGLALAFTFGCDAAKKENGLTDSRDGKKYKTVKIGEQTWMAENLNYAAEGSVCYDNKPENCTKYGRLYNWNTALKICPKGWHLPSGKEWDKLYRYVDGTSGTESSYPCSGSSTAGKFLKAKSGWLKTTREDGSLVDGNGTDAFGFAALPGGAVTSILTTDGYSYEFFGADIFGTWWSWSTLESSNVICSQNMNPVDGEEPEEDASAGCSCYFSEDRLYNVRCLKD